MLQFTQSQHSIILSALLVFPIVPFLLATIDRALAFAHFESFENDPDDDMDDNDEDDNDMDDDDDDDMDDNL